MGTLSNHLVDALYLRSQSISVEFHTSRDTVVAALDIATEYFTALWHGTGSVHLPADSHPHKSDLANLVYQYYQEYPGIETVLMGYRYLEYVNSLPALEELEIRVAISYLFIIEGWTRAIAS